MQFLPCRLLFLHQDMVKHALLHAILQLFFVRLRPPRVLAKSLSTIDSLTNVVSRESTRTQHICWCTTSILESIFSIIIFRTVSFHGCGFNAKNCVQSLQLVQICLCKCKFAFSQTGMEHEKIHCICELNPDFTRTIFQIMKSNFCLIQCTRSFPLKMCIRTHQIAL